MASESYKDKLLDPRWQKLRLKVLKRDKFKCFICNDKESTLHVHHTSYDKSGNPWDTDEAYLITLCKHCHTLEEYLKYKDYYLLSASKSLISSDIVRITCYIGRNMEDYFIGIFNVGNTKKVNGHIISIDAAREISEFYSKVFKRTRKNKICQE